jgi:hypothetical protein
VGGQFDLAFLRLRGLQRSGDEVVDHRLPQAFEGGLAEDIRAEREHLAQAGIHEANGAAAIDNHCAFLHGGKNDLEIRLRELALTTEVFVLHGHLLGALSELREIARQQVAAGLAALGDFLEHDVQQAHLPPPPALSDQRHNCPSQK